MRSDSLLTAIEQAGAKLQGEGPDAIVTDYGDAAAEAIAAFESPAVADQSARAIVTVTGDEAVEFVNRMCTNDIKSVNESTSVTAALTTAKGRIVDHLQVWQRDSNTLGLLGSAGMGANIHEWLQKYIVMETCELAERSAQEDCLLAFGSGIDAVVNKLFGACPAAGGEHPARVAGSFESQTVDLLATNAPGSHGVQIIAPASLSGAIFNALRSAGLRAVGDEAYEKARIEAGLPVLGRELGDHCNPLEAGLKQSVSFTKGCYIGQEVVARLNSYSKVRRHLSGIWFPPETDPTGLNEVFLDLLRVGQVTSAVQSPRLGATVALAFLKSGYEKVGGELEAMVHGERVSGTVKELPFTAE